MDTQTLSVFRDVAHKLSFAAVAKERGATPSSISRMIAALEADLQVRLFHRTTRKMVLTEAGARFLRHAERILDAAEEARDQARGTRSRPEGLVRLSASTAFGEHVLVPLLADFRKRHPGIQLDLVLSDDNLDLAAHGLDLAIRLGNRLEGDFISTRLFATSYRVCAAPDYLETAPPLDEPADLIRHRCLLFTLPEFRTCWRFKDADGETCEEEVAGDIAMSSAGSLLSAARQGLGPALLADWLVRRDLESGSLVDVFPEAEVTATSFETAAWLTYPSREYVPGRVRAVIEFLRSALPCQQEDRSRVAKIE